MNEKLVWLWTHCRALGMTEFSNAIPEDQRKNSNGMELDIALFVKSLVDENERLKQTNTIS